MGHQLSGVGELGRAVLSVVGVAVLLLSPAADAPAAGTAPAKWLVSEAPTSKGLALIVGCGNADLALAVAKRTRLAVRCIDTDVAAVTAARTRLADAGVYGRRVTVEQGSLASYPTHCANLIVANGVAADQFKDLYRVLNPNGVAFVGGADRDRLKAGLRAAGIGSYILEDRGGQWARITKPRGKTWDEWTHRNHDPANTYASRDGIGGPGLKLLWASMYQPGLASAAVLVAGGRLIEVGRGYRGFEETTPYVQVTDAFNGVRLWAKVGRTALGIDRPFSNYSAIRATSDVAAAGGRLYVLGGRLCHVLDLATGEQNAAWPIPAEARAAPTDIWLYVACIGDQLVGSVGPSPAHRGGWGQPHWREISKAVFALNRTTGKLKWVYNGPVATASLAAENGRALFLDRAHTIRSLDLATGREQWSRKTDLPARATVTHAALYRDRLWVMYSADGDVSSKARDRGWSVAVFSAKNGAPLRRLTFDGAVASMTFSEGVVFMAPQHGLGRIETLDAATGAILEGVVPVVRGSKCTPLIATPRWLFYRHQAGSGFVRIDRVTRRRYIYHRIRCTCHYPGIPANGLLYVQGPGCNCSHAFRANVALVPGARTPEPADRPGRLVRGPAYGQARAVDGPVWATWRADRTRSARTSEAAALPLTQAWSTRPGGTVTPVAAAEGLVFCGSTAHQLFALDAAAGRVRWRYVAEGRIRVAPHYWQGKVYAGDDGGWVHCVRARDGALVWKFRAKLGEDRVVAYGELMSAWPAGTGVLVHEGTAYFGSGFFPGDGGALFAVDATTGEVRWTKTRLTFRTTVDSVAGPLALGKTELFVPTVGGPPMTIPLASPNRITAPRRRWRGALSARGTWIMTLGDDVIAGSPDLRYIHHVARYYDLRRALPVVTDDVVYFRDGRHLTAEKRSAYKIHRKRGRFTWVQSKRPGRVVASQDPADRLWSAWKGVRMTAAIKAGAVIFSGGAGKVYATDSKTGREAWSAAVGGSVTDLAVCGGRLFAVTDAGDVVCFAPKGRP